LSAITGGRRAAQLAADYQVAHASSLEALLERDDVDAVLLATPQVGHAAQTAAAAAAGKHVLVEKPMALNAGECQSMIDDCARAGVVLSVIQTQRFRGTTARAKQLIDAGRIGKVRMIELRTLFELVPVLETHWLQEEINGGLLQDQGAHNFDFLRWFAGSEARAVFGQIQRVEGNPWPSPTAMAQVAFENGVMAQTWMSFELPKPGLENSSFRALVTGETGMLDIDGYGKLHGTFDGSEWSLIWEQPPIDYLNKPLEPVRLEAFFTQVQDFIDAIRERRRPSVTGEDGRATIALIDAVRRSAVTGEAVRPG
jgi:predicted dehydrogenase